jgi:glutathione synthase/RimK-type ligase-like ATP-grasp enzyme
LEEKEVLVLNRAGALFGAHDKLATALTLAARGLPHPRTGDVVGAADPPFELPVVVKPRFGSWGRDITVCRSRFAFARCVGASSRPGVRLVSDSRGQAEPSAGLLSLRRVEQA